MTTLTLDDAPCLVQIRLYAQDRDPALLLFVGLTDDPEPQAVCVVLDGSKSFLYSHREGELVKPDLSLLAPADAESYF